MITREDLRRYSLGVLGLLEREKIDSIEELKKRLGESFEVPEGIVQLEQAPSGLNPIPDSIAYTMSYIIRGKGIPLEVRLNPTVNYSLIIIKSGSTVDGYSQDFRDPLGNTIQSNRFELSFEGMKDELRRLAGHDS